MKTLFAALFLSIAIAGVADAQSKSYRTLREKFRGAPNVVSFSSSGFLTRTVFWIAGEDDYREALQDIRKVRMSIIPRQAFQSKHVTLNGFRNIAEKDGFEQLAHIRDGKDDIWLLLQGPETKNDNRYLLIVDSDEQVFVAEILGFVDPNLLFKDKKRVANKKI